jgi:hypothetical protein
VAYYFTDRNLGKRLAHALGDAAIDCQPYWERYEERVVPDADWIAEVTADDRVIITADSKIRSRTDEIDAFRLAGARCVFLTIKGGTVLANLRALMAAWPEIEAMAADQLAPWACGLARDGRITEYVVGASRPPSPWTPAPPSGS